MYNSLNFGTRLALLTVFFLTLLGFSNVGNAFSVIVTPPPTNPPTTTPPSGPNIPYISGRLGPVQAASDPPVGTVVPDDFCLPGKFEDCGEHLRDSVANSNSLDDEILFVGREGLAFGQSQQSLWVNGQTRQINQSAISEQQTITSVAVGGDRRFGENLVLGAMAIQESKTTTYSITGVQDNQSGVQVGPYFAYRLSETLVLDGRFVFGNSDHTITTSGVASGQFQSQGGFVAVRVSGTFDRGNWRLHPSLELANAFQSNDAYVDSVSGAVAASTVSDTFATVAALAYYNGLGVGNITPYAGLELTQPVNRGDAFGTFRTGVSMSMNNNAVLNLDFAQGAIGLPNTTDRQISVRLEVPF